MLMTGACSRAIVGGNRISDASSGAVFREMPRVVVAPSFELAGTATTRRFNDSSIVVTMAILRRDGREPAGQHMAELTFTYPKSPVIIEDPPIAKALFNDARMAWVWLPLRLWLGYQWLEAASHKITNPDWMGSGVAIRGFWERAVAVNPATGKDLVTYDWYQAFLNLLLVTNSEVWFGKLVAVGELAIGLGLILGAFVGVTAFFGGLMNWSFLMAGTVSTNPIMFAVTGVLILAWKTAGYYGLDRYLLPLVGTPWQRRDPGATTGLATSAKQVTTPRRGTA